MCRHVLVVSLSMLMFVACEATDLPSGNFDVVIEPLLPNGVETACFEVSGLSADGGFSREVCGKATRAMRVREACEGVAVELEIVSRALVDAEGREVTGRMQSPCTDEAPCVMTYHCDGREEASFRVLFVPKVPHGRVNVDVALELPREASRVCLDLEVRSSDGLSAPRRESLCVDGAGDQALSWVAPCVASAGPSEVAVAVARVSDAEGLGLARDVLGCGDGERCAMRFTCLEGESVSLAL
jgi:hypothetical protein